MKPVAANSRRSTLGRPGTKWRATLASGLLVAAVLGGCQPRGYVRDPRSWAEARDWSEAKPVRVALAEHSFSPQVLELQENTAYILEIANIGAEPHDFSAQEFFRAVAVGRVVFRGIAALAMARIEAIRLEPGAAVELLLVAVRPGTYPVTSDMAEDRRRGMGPPSACGPRNRPRNAPSSRRPPPLP